jgi:hypothetical protein
MASSGYSIMRIRRLVISIPGTYKIDSDAFKRLLNIINLLLFIMIHLLYFINQENTHLKLISI